MHALYLGMQGFHACCLSVFFPGLSPVHSSRRITVGAHTLRKHFHSLR